MKKPAARCAAGFDHGRLRKGRLAIRGGKAGLRPPLDDAGGVACRAAGRRVALAHSLPQGTSAGRNLITVFSTVNNLSRCRRIDMSNRLVIFSTTLPCQYARHAAQRACMQRHASLHASTGAASSRLKSVHGARPVRAPTHTPSSDARSLRLRSKRHGHARDAALIALHKRVCAKNARDFQTPRGQWRCKKKTRDVAAAGSMARAARRDQCASSSSSAYSSGPSSSLSWSASSASTVNSQPSP